MARIVIAGGSLGGLMAANLLLRDGHEVTVLEKAVGPLDGRGAGIVTHQALVDGLHRCGMERSTVLGVAVQGRVTLAVDGSVLGELAMPQVLTSWSRLHQILKDLFPAQKYRQGIAVRGVEQHSGGVRVQTSAGGLEADLLIAADGIRSVVRQQLWPQVQSSYAGYVAWRGLCEEMLLSRNCLQSVFERFSFGVPPGEQLIGYPVAGPGNRLEPGQRAWNFVWYRPAPEPGGLARLLTDADGVHHAQGIPPQKVSWREIARMRSDARQLLAPAFAEIMEKTAQPVLQPIHDLHSEQIVEGRVALIGDAAFVARPHVGMGVTKAMQDAVALADALRVHGANAAALQAYQQVRRPAGQRVVERGRRLGAYMQGLARDGFPAGQRDPLTPMAETAIDLDASDAAHAVSLQPAGARPVTDHA
jgi:2-polyprenyl-6-methoxyphenol hydroxylase-like FAD-dependent oxidoreductase